MLYIIVDKTRLAFFEYTTTLNRRILQTDQNTTLKKMQSFGVKIIALVGFLILLSSCVADRGHGHIIEKHLGHEADRDHGHVIEKRSGYKRYYSYLRMLYSLPYLQAWAPPPPGR